MCDDVTEAMMFFADLYHSLKEPKEEKKDTSMFKNMIMAKIPDKQEDNKRLKILCGVFGFSDDDGIILTRDRIKIFTSSDLCEKISKMQSKFGLIIDEVFDYDKDDPYHYFAQYDTLYSKIEVLKTLLPKTINFVFLMEILWILTGKPLNVNSMFHIDNNVVEDILNYWLSTRSDLGSRGIPEIIKKFENYRWPHRAKVDVLNYIDYMLMTIQYSTDGRKVFFPDEMFKNILFFKQLKREIKSTFGKRN